MGCQGEIYNIYGVEVDAIICSCPNGRERNPIVYSINGVVLADRNEMDEIEEDPNLTDTLCFDDIHYHGIPTLEYGAYNLDDPELVTVILGHDYSLDMGARHFEGKALIGFAVCNESYLNSAQKLPELDKIKSLDNKLHDKIFEMYGLNTNSDTYHLWLYFDFINGF